MIKKLVIRFAYSIFVLSCILSIFCVMPSAAAQVQEAETGNPPEQMNTEKMQVPPRLGVAGETTLSLSEAIRMALANNREIESARIDTQIARFSLNSAQGAYDPKFSIQAPYRKSTTPMGSVLAGTKDGKALQRDISVGPQLNGILPWTGASFGVSFSLSRSITNNSFATLNPQYPSSMTFSITQPLLRGFRFDANRQRVEVARKNMALSDAQFRQRVTEIVTQTTKAYWDLVYALQNLDVQVVAAETAKRQVESNQRMAEQGVLAPIDIVEAETQLAQFEQNIYNAQVVLSTAENILKTMILPDRTSPLWSRALIPITEPEAPPEEELFEDAINEAMANRPELSQTKIAEEVSQTNLRYYRDQAKPKIDLVASYTSSGLAGFVRESTSNPFTGGFPILIERLNELSSSQGLPPIDDSAFSSFSGSGVPQILIGGIGHSLSNLYSLGFPTFQVGLQLSLPLRNQEAKANVAAGRAELRRSEVRYQQVEQRIQAEVINSMQSLASLKNGLKAARVARHSAREQYESEQRKFKAGTSIVFLVLQRQTTLVTAQSSELRAKTELAKAIADFEQATGRTLKTHNVVLKTVQND